MATYYKCTKQILPVDNEVVGFANGEIYIVRNIDGFDHITPLMESVTDVPFPKIKLDDALVATNFALQNEADLTEVYNVSKVLEPKPIDTIGTTQTMSILNKVFIGRYKSISEALTASYLGTKVDSLDYEIYKPLYLVEAEKISSVTITKK